VITGQQGDPIAELPELIAAGVPTAKAFMVYDFRLPDERLFQALRTMGRHGGMLEVHCENATVIDALVRDALARGNVACRHHALSRPTYAEAEATHRAIALARAAGAPVYIVHLSCADALAEVAAAKARGWPVFAETCPHYLTLTDERYDAADEGEVIRSVISPPLRSEADRQALWLGLQRRELQVVSTDHAPFNYAGQKELGLHDFTKIPNGLPGVEHRVVLLYEGVRTGKLTLQHFVDLVATTPAKLFGLYPRKGTIAPGSDADLLIWNPQKSMTISAATQRQRVDYTPYEGMQLQGVPETVLLRGNVIVRNGEYTGVKGGGQYVSRSTFSAHLS